MYMLSYHLLLDPPDDRYLRGFLNKSLCALVAFPMRATYSAHRNLRDLTHQQYQLHAQNRLKPNSCSAGHKYPSFMKPESPLS